jgi:PAS domain S-box-containing protein
MSEAVVADVRVLSVLLLEDSRFDAELLRENLLRSYPRAALTVVVDEAGFAAALARGGWDAILSDYEIPGFSGSHALQMAREARPRTPFIFVSGVIGEDNAVEMLKRGATDYVSKSRLSRLPVVLERALQEVSERDGRSRAEARLREADAMYARVVDALRDYAVILLDARGGIQSWNGAARDMFGFEADEVLGRSAELLFVPDDRAAGALQAEMQAALRDGSASGERWLLRRDGLHMRADGVLTPLHADDRAHTGFCRIVRDVTQQYRSAEALRAAKEQAEQANLAKDRFLAVLSHELRTPLTPIVTATHLLERCAQVPTAQQHLLPMIRRNVALEARLIDDLLDVAAISAGKVRLNPTVVDMHHVVDRVGDMLGDLLEQGGLTLVQELHAEHPLVQADEARMQQVVWNLVRNSIKFTPAGGRIVLRTASAGGHLLLECIDTGIGIEAEALPRIFTPFEQGDRDMARRYGGLGLGLAIARGLAAEHGGQLSAHSAGRGQGATFTLKLRVLDHAAAAASTMQPPLALADAQDCRLLLVEDNVDAAQALMELLQSYGYVVSHAASCAQAFAAAREARFDVVLTDLGLPDGSGIDVGRALSGSMPVVALSGYGASPDLQRSAMAGFSGHLVKPAGPEAIHRALQLALRQHEGRQAPALQRA